MKINYKKTLLAVTMASLLIGSGGVYADQTPTQVGDLEEMPKVISTNAFSMPTYFILNDQLMKFNRLQMPFASPKGQVMVPLKVFSQSLGYEVSWNAAEKMVHLTFDGQDHGFKVIKNKDQEFKMSLKDDAGREYTASIQLGSLYVTPNFFVEAMNAVVVYDHDNQLRIDGSRYIPNEASTTGEIVKLEQGKDGIQILVKGSKHGQFGFDEISLAVSKNAEIILSNGKKVALGDLKVGDQIYVIYNMAVTKSLPPMSQAQKVTVLKEEAVLTGKVFFKQSSEEKYPGTAGIAPTTHQLRVVGTNDYFLTLSKDALIIGADGSQKTFADIKEGSLVRVFTAPYAAMSYPAQTTAYRIEIIK